MLFYETIIPLRVSLFRCMKQSEATGTRSHVKKSNIKSQGVEHSVITFLQVIFFLDFLLWPLLITSAKPKPTKGELLTVKTDFRQQKNNNNVYS